jgi:NAD(P)-dependent dehydrogenase (short-subunit alcohol dehydrogenase family)
MDLGLDGKVVLVTGGTDGLGLATAERVLDEGGSVAVCGRNRERLRAAATRLGSRGDAFAMRADVTDPDDRAALIEAVRARWGRLDGLVNNAGRASAGAFDAISDDAWEDDLDLKVHAAVRLTRAALPLLRVRGGAVVNVLSIYAKAPIGNAMPSSVSRAAGLGLTKALSHDLGAVGVRVNAVLVGFVESGQWARSAATAGVDIEVWKRTAFGHLDIPLGRTGEASEFADVAAFLLSPRASYVTGTALNVDGGLCPVP